MRAGAGSDAYRDDDIVHDTSVACDSGECWCRGRRGCRVLVRPCHVSTACLACFAVAQEGRAAAQEDDAETDEDRGVAKQQQQQQAVFTRENRGRSAQHATLATPTQATVR